MLELDLKIDDLSFSKTLQSISKEDLKTREPVKLLYFSVACMEICGLHLSSKIVTYFRSFPYASALPPLLQHLHTLYSFPRLFRDKGFSLIFLQGPNLISV